MPRLPRFSIAFASRRFQNGAKMPCRDFPTDPWRTHHGIPGAIPRSPSIEIGLPTSLLMLRNVSCSRPFPAEHPLSASASSEIA